MSKKIKKSSSKKAPIEDNLFEAEDPFKEPEEIKNLDTDDKIKVDPFGIEPEQEISYEPQIKEIYKLFDDNPTIQDIKLNNLDKYTKEVYDKLKHYLDSERINNMIVMICGMSTELYERALRVIGIKSNGLATSLMKNQAFFDGFRKVLYKHNLVGTFERVSDPLVIVTISLLYETYETHYKNKQSEILLKKIEDERLAEEAKRQAEIIKTTIPPTVPPVQNDVEIIISDPIKI